MKGKDIDSILNPAKSAKIIFPISCLIAAIFTFTLILSSAKNNKKEFERYQEAVSSCRWIKYNNIEKLGISEFLKTEGFSSNNNIIIEDYSARFVKRNRRDLSGEGLYPDLNDDGIVGRIY